MGKDQRIAASPFVDCPLSIVSALPLVKNWPELGAAVLYGAGCRQAGAVGKKKESKKSTGKRQNETLGVGVDVMDGIC